MANPTLISADTTWAGWTPAELIDEILRPFGLTTGTNTRVVANTDESALARDALRLAATYLNSKYPSIWARRIYSVAWTAGDHSIVIPVNAKMIERVFYNGLPLDSLTVEDRTRLANSDDNTNEWKVSSSAPIYYYVSGITDSNGDGSVYQSVLRLVPTPEDADTLEIHMIARSPDFASGDDANATEFDPLFHDWLVQRGVEILAGKLGSARNIHEDAFAERQKIEGIIFDHLEGSGEYPDRIRWQYPTEADRKRR